MYYPPVSGFLWIWFFLLILNLILNFYYLREIRAKKRVPVYWLSLALFFVAVAVEKWTAFPEVEIDVTITRIFFFWNIALTALSTCFYLWTFRKPGSYFGTLALFVFQSFLIWWITGVIASC